MVDVELVQQWITILLLRLVKFRETRDLKTNLGDRRGKDHNLIQFTDALHELVNARSLYDVDVVIGSLNLHGNGKVGLVKELLK